MRIVTVTSAGDTPVAGEVTLRQALASAGGGETIIRFAEGLRAINIGSHIEIDRGTIRIEGDIDGDGVGDIVIDSAEHHLTIGQNASVHISDVLFWGGTKTGEVGENGESQASVELGRAADGTNGVKIEPRDDIASAVIDGTDGTDGLNGADGGAAKAGEDVAGSIENRGSLVLERVNFGNNFAEAGRGGDGGDGQRGQNGGSGGQGTLGAATSGFKVLISENNRDGGRGGHAGDGGDGGAGGAGGKGGDAAAAILNDGGSIRMIDVSFGGRSFIGTLTDRFTQYAIAGDGGTGGFGGDGGQAGSAGSGGNDSYTGTPAFSSPNGDTFLMFDGNNEQVFVHRQYVANDGKRYYTPMVPLEGFGVSVANTVGGAAGDGGDGGDGGAAGANGPGGNAAMIINRGSITGTYALGRGAEAEAGEGFWDNLSPLPEAGTGGVATHGGDGGAESTTDFLRTRYADLRPLATDFRHWDDPPELVLADGGRPVRVGGAFRTAPVKGPEYAVPDPQPDGRDGVAGADGAAGVEGDTGKKAAGIYSEGSTAGSTGSDGLIYLSGVRQDDDLGALKFSVVRVGDTSAALTVRYVVEGVGPSGATRADFANPGQLTGTLTFDAIDQAAAPFDTEGRGMVQIAIRLKKDGLFERGEDVRIRLLSDDATLGTSQEGLTIHDGDLRRVSGTEADDRNLTGRRGQDLIDAGEGNDRLSGKDGRDILIGGEGRDVLDGGGGNDVLEGGGGADTFVLRGKTGRDVITDFGGDDILDLSAFAGLTFRDLNLRDTADGLLVDFGLGTVLLEGLERTDIRAGDFDFG